MTAKNKGEIPSSATAMHLPCDPIGELRSLMKVLECRVQKARATTDCLA
jgi:hypothetical protein